MIATVPPETISFAIWLRTPAKKSSSSRSSDVCSERRTRPRPRSTACMWRSKEQARRSRCSTRTASRTPAARRNASSPCCRITWVQVPLHKCRKRRCPERVAAFSVWREPARRAPAPKPYSLLIRACPCGAGCPGPVPQLFCQAVECRCPCQQGDVQKSGGQRVKKIEAHGQIHLVGACGIHAQRKYRAPVKRVVAHGKFLVYIAPELEHDQHGYPPHARCPVENGESLQKRQQRV